MVLRAKGIVDSYEGEWIHFDYIPNSIDIRYGAADVCGKLCVIGAELKEDRISAIFEVK